MASRPAAFLLAGLLVALFGALAAGSIQGIATAATGFARARAAWLMLGPDMVVAVTAGLVLSSLLFSLAHALGTSFAPLAALNLFLFGVFAALYAWSAGGLWGVCAWHALWNWAHGRLLGFSVSGSAAEAGLLTSVAPTGPETITGGRFGPEGGLAAMFVFLCAIGALMVARRRDHRP